MKSRTLLVFILVLFACNFCPAQSQLGSGAISGTVTDPSGQVVADASVTVTGSDTGLVRKVTTTGAGTFTIPVLPTGLYGVRVEKAGFSTLEQKGLVVNVGGTTTLQLQLKVGAVQTVVEVAAEAAAVDTARSDESSLVTRQQINELPINGRRYDQFALMVPGVARDGSYGLLTYRGISGVFNNYSVDGNDDNQAYTAAPRGYTRIASSVSANAIQEFQVGRSNFLPEFGRSAGGGINAVVRSGSNSFHFDGFEYFKSSAISARDPLATVKPDETRHQFGGSISGPIKADKLFYFVNYDQQLRSYPLLIEDLNKTLTSCKPVVSGDQAACDAAVALMLTKFPGGGPGHTLPRTYDQNLLLAKVDWIVSPRNTLSLTYNYLNHRGQNAVQSVVVMGYVTNNGQDNVRTQTVNGRLTSLLSSHLINELRSQYSRDFEFQNSNSPGPQVAISGGFQWGQSQYLPRYSYPDERKQQVVDNLSFIKGSHAFKFGGEVVRAHDILDWNQNYAGAYSYSTVLALGKDLLNPAGKTYANFYQGFGMSGVNYTTFDYAAFAQDQWRIRRNVTLNYGIRYDYQKLPAPQHPNPAFPETTKFNADRKNFGPRAGMAWDLFGNSKTVVRAGYGMMFARSPNGLLANALMQTGLTDPTQAVISMTVRPTDAWSPVFPNILSAIPTGAAGSSSTTRIGSDFVRPRVQEINIGVDQQLGWGMVLSASLIYTKGDRFPVLFDVNSLAPNFTRTFLFPDGSTVNVPFSAGITKTATGGSVSCPSSTGGAAAVCTNGNFSRPNPAYGAINATRSLGENWYQGLLVELKRSFSRGILLNIAYTLAKAENYAGGGSGYGGAAEGAYGGAYVWDQFNLKSNKGVAPTDQRHRLVSSMIWALPFKSDNAALDRLIHGYQLGGILTAETGRPYSPSLSSTYLPFAAPDGSQWTSLGGAANGQGGLYQVPGVGRNGYSGHASAKIDLRVSRNFRITERLKFELLAEGFNIFNSTIFNQFNTRMYSVTASKATDPVAKPVVLTADPTFAIATGDGFPPDGTAARRLQLSARIRF